MVHIGLIIWHQFLFCKINVLLSVFIVSKIENIPVIRKFSKIKNKKTAITFGEECIFRITGPLWGQFTGHRWIPLTKTSDAEFWCFLWSAAEPTGWANHRDTGDLRHHRAHYDVTLMHHLNQCCSISPEHIYIPIGRSEFCIYSLVARRFG